MKMNLKMLENLVIWKTLDRFPPNNHIEFECKFNFSMKNYEIIGWHGDNSSYLVTTKHVWIFPPC
jgi:hypothetical protein